MKIIRIITLLVFFIILFFIGALIIDSMNIKRKYKNIELKSSLNDIKQLFGEPDFSEQYADTLYHHYTYPFNKHVFIYKDTLLVKKWKENNLWIAPY